MSLHTTATAGQLTQASNALYEYVQSRVPPIRFMLGSLQHCDPSNPDAPVSVAIIAVAEGRSAVEAEGDKLVELFLQEQDEGHPAEG